MSFIIHKIVINFHNNTSSQKTSEMWCVIKCHLSQRHAWIVILAMLITQYKSCSQKISLSFCPSIVLSLLFFIYFHLLLLKDIFHRKARRLPRTQTECLVMWKIENQDHVLQPFQCGDHLYTSGSDVCRRQILTYKDGLRTGRIKTFLTAVDPYHKYSSESGRAN